LITGHSCHVKPFEVKLNLKSISMNGIPDFKIYTRQAQKFNMKLERDVLKKKVQKKKTFSEDH